MTCPIKGCAGHLHKNVPMCWAHMRKLTEPLQKTLQLLANDGSGKPRPGYEEACTSAVDQVRQMLEPGLQVLDPYTNWPFRGAKR